MGRSTDRVQNQKFEKVADETESIFKRNDSVLESLSLQEQLDLLSEIPNNHHFLWSLKDPAKQQVKFEQQFSTSTHYPCGSPRNRIINTVVYNNKPSTIVHALHTMLDIFDGPDVSAPPAKRRRCAFEKKKRATVNTSSMCAHYGIDEEEVTKLSENMSSISSQKNRKEKFYVNYVERLFTAGCLKWRVFKAPSLQIILMNDIDRETGEFKVTCSIKIANNKA